MELIHTNTLKDIGPISTEHYTKILSDDNSESGVVHACFDSISHKFVQIYPKNKDNATIITVNVLDLDYPKSVNITQINYEFPPDINFCSIGYEASIIVHNNKLLFVTQNDHDEQYILWIVTLRDGKIISHVINNNYYLNDFDDNYIYVVSESGPFFHLLRAKYSCTSLIYETLIEIKSDWSELYLRDNKFIIVEWSRENELVIRADGIGFTFNNDTHEFIGVVNLHYVMIRDKTDHTLSLYEWNSGQYIKLSFNGANDVLNAIEDNVIVSYYIDNEKLSIWFHEDGHDYNNIHEFSCSLSTYNYEKLSLPSISKCSH